MGKIKFSKPALTVEKQIELLKSRGLIINDIDFAQNILSNITYYRLSAYMSEKLLTQSFRMHLKRIGLNKDLYELVKYCLNECLGDEQEYHKNEVERINTETEQCKEILKRMYLDQVNNVLDYNMWVNLKNEYEVKLSRLNAELQKHTIANTNFLDTGLQILDLCSKASLPATELLPEEVAQIVRATYLSVTVNNKKVKMVFKEPFATIEKLIKLAKKEIAQTGMPAFKAAIISSKGKYIESIKKEPEGSVSNCSNCFKWWRLGDFSWICSTLTKFRICGFATLCSICSLSGLVLLRPSANPPNSNLEFSYQNIPKIKEIPFGISFIFGG